MHQCSWGDVFLFCVIEGSIKIDHIWHLSRKQWPTKWYRFDASLLEIGIMFPYISARVWFFEDKFCALINILVYTPSKRFSRSSFMVQVSAPYNRILSTEARKNASLVSLAISDFNIKCSLFQADQASTLRMLKSFLLSDIWP